MLWPHLPPVRRVTRAMPSTSSVSDIARGFGCWDQDGSGIGSVVLLDGAALHLANHGGSPYLLLRDPADGKLLGSSPIATGGTTPTHGGLRIADDCAAYGDGTLIDPAGAMTSFSGLAEVGAYYYGAIAHGGYLYWRYTNAAGDMVWQRVDSSGTVETATMAAADGGSSFDHGSSFDMPPEDGITPQTAAHSYFCHDGDRYYVIGGLGICAFPGAFGASYEIGDKLWEVSFSGTDKACLAQNSETLFAFTPGPVLVVFPTLAAGFYLVIIDKATGATIRTVAVIFSPSLPSAPSHLFANEDHVLLQYDGDLWCYNVAGDLQWTTSDVSSRLVTMSLLAGDRVFQVGTDATFQGSIPHMRARDAATGDLLWWKRVEPTTCKLICADDEFVAAGYIRGRLDFHAPALDFSDEPETIQSSFPPVLASIPETWP